MADHTSKKDEPESHGAQQPSDGSNVRSEQNEEEHTLIHGDSNAQGNQKDDAEPEPAPSTKAQKVKAKVEEKKQKAHDIANPPGGHDATPIPSAPDGYTVKFTFVRAENLPVADIGTVSSDPFVLATLTSPRISQRHKQDPDMRLRTHTIHKDTNPKWNQEWIVAGVPSSGFKLKCRIYDEDSSDHDDRLGNVTLVVPSIGEGWEGIKEASYPVKKRMGSWRAYLVQGITAACSRETEFTARLVLSVEVLGKSDPPHGRMYTLGPTVWTKHNSPMIGRIAGTKAPQAPAEEGSEEKPKVEKYDFQANQIQLQGPVPAELYHRFVEFKPFVKGMFDKAGLRGRVLNNVLHHQHARVYNYSSTTCYGAVEPKSAEATLQFLEMAHFDEGSRLFTYVLTLDGLLRFTETGKEFGIDMLSKHTMHSDVNVYIACSGEFLIRRVRDKLKGPEAPVPQTQAVEAIEGGPPSSSPAPRDPADYELVIDNDSGTYRPDAAYLPQLGGFLEANFPGLKIVTRGCTDEKLQRIKRERREAKKKQGGERVFQSHSDSEWSSSDEESLDERAAGKQSKRERMVDALEDPQTALRNLRHGGAAQREREEREEADDTANPTTVGPGEGMAPK